MQPTKTIADIVPSARPHFERLLAEAEKRGMQPRIRSAGRTCADQNALHALGPGVTGAALCRSLHVIGRALDIDLSPSTCATYTELGQFWEQMGGFWGGRWTQFGGCGDAGHFHWFPKEGGGNHQAVPESICPAALSVADCESRRLSYLEGEFAQKGPRSTAWVGAGLLIVGAGMTIMALQR